MCTPDSDADSNFNCSVIKCIVRRNAVTDDPDDYSFNFVGDGNSGDKTVKVASKNSYILLNQADKTTPHKMELLTDATLTINKQAVSSFVTSVATAVAALSALSFF